MKRNIDIDRVKQLWSSVKKEITTENAKLINAIDSFEKYLYQ